MGAVQKDGAREPGVAGNPVPEVCTDRPGAFRSKGLVGRNGLLPLFKLSGQDFPGKQGGTAGKTPVPE